MSGISETMQEIELNEFKSDKNQWNNKVEIKPEKKNLLEPLNAITRVDSYKGLPKAKNGEVDIERASESGSQRLQWSNHIEYVLSVVGFVIDLGNVIK